MTTPARRASNASPPSAPITEATREDPLAGAVEILESQLGCLERRVRRIEDLLRQLPLRLALRAERGELLKLSFEIQDRLGDMKSRLGLERSPRPRPRRATSKSRDAA